MSAGEPRPPTPPACRGPAQGCPSAGPAVPFPPPLARAHVASSLALSVPRCTSCCPSPRLPCQAGRLESSASHGVSHTPSVQARGRPAPAPPPSSLREGVRRPGRSGQAAPSWQQGSRHAPGHHASPAAPRPPVSDGPGLSLRLGGAMTLGGWRRAPQTRGALHHLRDSRGTHGHRPGCRVPSPRRAE